MLTLDPGPLDLIDAAALQPFPPPPSFTDLAVSAASALTGADRAAASVGADVAAPLPVDVDGSHTVNIAPAVASLDAEARLDRTGIVSTLAGSVDSASGIRSSVLVYLPQPSAPVETPFVDPPIPAGSTLDTGSAPTDVQNIYGE